MSVSLSVFRRRLAVATAGVLAASGLALVAPSGAPANATEATTTVTFKDCEVREDPYGTNHRIKDNITWTTPVRLNIPSPVRAGVQITAETQFGDLPADLLPVALHDFEIDSDVSFSVDGSSDLSMRTYNVSYGTYDPSTSLLMDELEVDTTWSDAGMYVHRPTQVYFEMTGLDAADDYLEFTFACDNVVNPPILLTVAVYDPSATPVIVLDKYAAKQGATIQIVGANLLSAAPTDPAAEATVTIGGVTIGSYPIDESGALDVRVKVPAYAAPGSVQVRAANGVRSASTSMQVTATKGKVTASPKAVAKGKKVTLQGSRFKPREKVALVLKGGRGKGAKAFKASVKVRADGTFTKALKLKKSAAGKWRVTATGAASKRTARTSFRVR